jgi:salicylate hydroxylase
LADGSSHNADLIVAADGVHTSAIHHVIGHATPVVSTGWAVFRFLIPAEEMRIDPDLSPLIQDGATKLEDGLMRIFVAEGSMKRLVWYPCAE